MPMSAASGPAELVDIDAHLEFLELQEKTDEIDTLVCDLREELEAEAQSRSPASKSPSKRDSDHPGAGRSPSGQGELVIQPLPSIAVPSSGEEHFGMLLGYDDKDRTVSTNLEGEHAEESHLKGCLQDVAERLTRLEKRLEDWKEEQQGWLERHVVHGGLPPNLLAKSVRAWEQGVDYNLLKEWSKLSVRGTRRSHRTSSRSGARLSGLARQPTFPPIPSSPRTTQNSNGIREFVSSTSSRQPQEQATDEVAAEATEDQSMHGRARTVRPQFLDDGEGMAAQPPHEGKTDSSKGSGDDDPKSETPRKTDCSKGSGHSGKASCLQKPVDKAKILSDTQPSILTTQQTGFSHVGNHSQQTMVFRIVARPAFDYFFATMILLNSLFIGMQTEWKARQLHEKEPAWLEIVEQVFAYMFAFELMMRIGALKTAFFNPKIVVWNVFDMILVAMSFAEIILNAVTGDADRGGGSSGTAGKVIRMFRMARIVRIMRVLRFLAELRIMVTLIANSARSLFWLMVLLMGILYVFAIFFTQGVTEYLKDPENEGHGQTDLLLHNYGSMVNSAYTLFASITGGVSWRDVLSPLGHTGWGFTALFILYIFFCIFSVLNIVTGVFVDGAIQRSSQERDLRLEKEKEQKKMYVSMLTDLLEEIDSEGTGVISRQDLEDAFKSEQVRYYFSVLDIDVTDSNYLFDMLDLDRSGEVDMEEFVSGCLRLKGNAKSIDIHTLMYEIKLMIKQMSFFMEFFFQEARSDSRCSRNY